MSNTRGPVPSTAADYFGSMAAEYDSLIRRAVPRYDEMTQRLLDYLPRSAGRVLELGCGTGNLTLELARRYPRAAITTVDASRDMVELTRARLAAEGLPREGRAESVVARFEELDVAPGSFDLVTSAISLHHVVDKGAVYRSVYKWLAPGGTFRFADQMAGATAESSDLNWARWLEFCRQPGHASEEEVRSLVEHANAHDHYTPIPEHFRLLGAAGFEAARIDCVWKNWMWGIVTAEK